MPDVAFCSVGLPDPTQGGSGIFNYLVPKYLLERGVSVRAWFRYPDWFAGAARPQYLEELERLGLEAEHAVATPSPDAFGLGLIERNHQVVLCREIVERERAALESADAVISLDLGWALALAPVDRPHVAVLGDPQERHLAEGFRLDVRSRASWRRWLQVQSLRGVWRRLRPQLEAYDGERRVLGHWSPHHAAELRTVGIACRHLQWFTPDPGPVERHPSRDGALVMLHVGALGTTASRRMLAYWRDALFPAFATLPFELEIRLVGAGGDDLAGYAQPPNVRLRLLGQLDDVTGEFARAAVFFTPMKHRTGIRTRVVTALSHAVPVIADETTTLGLPELVDGRDVVYASDAAAVYAALERMHDEPDWAEAIGAAGRATWERHFDPAQNIPKLTALVGL